MVRGSADVRVRVRHAELVKAQTVGDDGTVTLTMSHAELVALREVVAFLDFLGELPSRHKGEDLVVDALLRTADPLILELGTDNYNTAVEAAWTQIASE